MTTSSCFFLIRTKTRSTWGRPWSGTSSRSRSYRWTETFTSTSWNTELGSKTLVKWRSWINLCFSFVQYPFFVAWLSLSAHKAGSNLSVELIIQVAFFIVTLITRATSKVGTRQVTCYENLIIKSFSYQMLKPSATYLLLAFGRKFWYVGVGVECMPR